MLVARAPPFALECASSAECFRACLQGAALLDPEATASSAADVLDVSARPYLARRELDVLSRAPGERSEPELASGRDTVGHAGLVLVVPVERFYERVRVRDLVRFVLPIELDP